MNTRTTVGNGAFTGAVAALLWAAQQPFDKRLFRSGYDDVELLGKLVTRGRTWLPVGVLLHVGNGAIFGAVFALMKPALPGTPVTQGLGAAMVEHFGLWPLGRVSDRFHPARRELPKLTSNRRALAQATWRHVLFGVTLGVVENRLNADFAP